MAQDRPRVFISYSHDSAEHRERVLVLADRLRTEGIDVRLDQYEPAPAEGWPQWMDRQIEECAFVVVVATATYERRFKGREESGRGLGVTWEGAILTQDLYEASTRNTKHIAVVFGAGDAEHIPKVLRAFTWYDVATDAGYEALCRRPPRPGRRESS